MAITALQSGASGLSALNTSLDIIANNLANVNTPGFKSSRANFEDLLYVEKMQPGAENSTGGQRPIGLYVGLGTRVSGTEVDFTQGSPVTTGKDLDITIDGTGFFRVRVPDSIGGGFAYTRAGAFTLNSQGEVVMASNTGYRLDPNLVIPAGATRPIDIHKDGQVYVVVPPDINPQLIGQIELAAFINPTGLKQVGDNLYTETAASGPPQIGNPETNQLGSLEAGYLEGSNVDPTRELIDLIKTQRAFEMNSNTIRAADETLRAVAQLNR